MHPAAHFAFILTLGRKKALHTKNWEARQYQGIGSVNYFCNAVELYFTVKFIRFSYTILAQREDYTKVVATRYVAK